MVTSVRFAIDGIHGVYSAARRFQSGHGPPARGQSGAAVFIAHVRRDSAAPHRCQGQPVLSRRRPGAAEAPRRDLRRRRGPERERGLPGRDHAPPARDRAALPELLLLLDVHAAHRRGRPHDRALPRLRHPPHADGDSPPEPEGRPRWHGALLGLGSPHPLGLRPPQEPRTALERHRLLGARPLAHRRRGTVRGPSPRGAGHSLEVGLGLGRNRGGLRRSHGPPPLAGPQEVEREGSEGGRAVLHALARTDSDREVHPRGGHPHGRVLPQVPSGHLQELVPLGPSLQLVQQPRLPLQRSRDAPRRARA